jgi:hypothetical protein
MFGRDIEGEARRLFPSLPPFAALNTDAGRLFLLALIDAVGGVDLLICDNVMSLIEGDQKDEVPWSATLPFITTLSQRRIGQLWLDHTGHITDRQYGSSTKAWRFDAVGIMAPLADGENDPRSTAFTLSFDHPGKARRRTPGNWKQFETQTIRLVDDKWISECAKGRRGGPEAKLKPQAIAQYRALQDALVVSLMPGRTTRDNWYAECVRLGICDAIPPGADWKVKADVQKGFRARLSELKIANWIGVDGESVTDLRGGRRKQ